VRGEERGNGGRSTGMGTGGSGVILGPCGPRAPLCSSRQLQRNIAGHMHVIGIEAGSKNGCAGAPLNPNEGGGTKGGGSAPFSGRKRKVPGLLGPPPRTLIHLSRVWHPPKAAGGPKRSRKGMNTRAGGPERVRALPTAPAPVGRPDHYRYIKHATLRLKTQSRHSLATFTWGFWDITTGLRMVFLGT
jgi:hypothetical protein